MSWRNRVAVVIAIAAGLLAVYIGYTRLGGVQTPAGQLSLTDLDRSGFLAFEQIFDAAADRVRIVGLFSPT